MEGSDDWRDQLQDQLPGLRQESLETIMMILKRYNPRVDEERLLEVQKFAQRFEEMAYATATSLSHYHEKIESKMLSIENMSDWRIPVLPAEVRQKIVNKIMDTLRRHIPFSEEGEDQLQLIAQRFEEKIYTTATSQSDYLRRISLKMLTMETKHANSVL